MRVRIIRQTFVGGELVEPAKPGKDGKPPKDDDGIITVSGTDGHNLISAGKALPVGDALSPVTNRTLDGSAAETK